MPFRIHKDYTCPVSGWDFSIFIEECVVQNVLQFFANVSNILQIFEKLYQIHCRFLKNSAICIAFKSAVFLDNTFWYTYVLFCNF